MAAPLPGAQIGVQGVAFRDRGGVVLDLDSDELGIQNIGGVLKQVNPNGTTSNLGGGGGSDPGTVVTLGGAAATIDFTVNGDNDGDYVIYGEIFFVTGADSDLLIRFNNDSNTANYMIGTQYANGLTTTNVAAQALGTGYPGTADGGVPLARAGQSAARDRVQFYAYVTSKSGRKRLVNSHALTSSSAEAPFAEYTGSGAWKDTASNITTVSITTQAGTSILNTGSYVKLIKRGATA